MLARFASCWRRPARPNRIRAPPRNRSAALELIGQVFGVNRIQQTDSQVSAGDNSFVFWVRTGSFGDINRGRDIVIPDGVRISTADPGGPVYLTNAIVLPAQQSQVSFSARPLYAGSAGNAPAGVISQHNFTGYTQAAFGSLLVRNDFGIIGGRDTEDDESYRYRIHLKLQSHSGVNEAALRYELLQLPGIQDVVFSPYAGGFYVYLYGISPVVPPSLLSLADQRINDRAAFPITGTALSPDLVGISLATTVILAAGVSSAEADIVIATARNAAETYINNLGIGAPLVINEIADRIRNADSRIADVGRPNDQIPEIFIWRSRSDGSRYSRYLVANYTPSLGERIVVESSLGSAIAITQDS